MKDRFYMACLRDNVGGNMAFHSKGGRGYTTDIRKAEVYDRGTAQRKWNHLREFDLPVSADHVDELAVMKVDYQYLPEHDPTACIYNKWVAFHPNYYSGNDLYWRGSDKPSIDLNDAIVFGHYLKPTARLQYVPLEIAQEIARPTFEYKQLNRRKMVQGAGMVTPDHVKKFKRKQRRVTEGKFRHNCPSCGRINWQFNPYDFDKCGNRDCELYKFE